MRSFIKAGLLVGAIIPASVLGLQNGDFSELDMRGLGDVAYPVDGQDIGFLPSWTMLTPGGFIRTEAGFGADSDSAFAFETLDRGFGDNKLEQCLPIDSDQSLTIRYSIMTNVADNNAQTRINPNFYASMADCEVNLQADENGNRLSFALSNEDFDTQLGLGGVEAGEWFEPAPVAFSASDLPDEVAVLRLSLRARDRVEGVDAEIFFDNVRVTQGDSPVNLVRNPSFEHIDVADGDFLSGSDGWYAELNPGIRAAAGAASFAISGDNVFYFENQEGGFGAARIDQCVVYDGAQTVRPSLRATSLAPDPQLSVRTNTAFFADDACADSASTSALEQDFPLVAESGEWQTLINTEQLDATQLVDVGSIRLSIRVRDRSGPEADAPGPFARSIYLDDINLFEVVPAPTFNPPSQEFSAAQLVVTVNGPEGSTLFYTLDGTDPTMESMSLQPGETLTITETTTVRAIAFLDDAMSAVRSATYTRVEAPVEVPTGPLNRSTGSIGFGFALLGTLLLFRRR
ncbi:MAG: chitobiase/beta-hexosaminidase C-terminal domain-containing protein [Alcanivorax sp.]|nr:chitobiase/beta-hexosaminidase C-terminal domain-containing protein [Alcanivorax sp.]